MTDAILPAKPLRPDQRLDLALPVPVALERLLLAQLDRVNSALALDGPSVDDQIHEARKRMKRFRGLIRLVRDRVGKEAYRRENVAIRDVARAIAPLRDGWALVLTLDRLTSENAGLVDPDPEGRLRAELLAAHGRQRARILGDPDLLSSLRTATVQVRGRVAGWGLGASGAATGQGADFATIEAGLRREYRRGQRDHEQARQRGDEAVFHDWRKSVKYLRHQIEALQPIRPDALDALATSLDALGEALGDDHDLAVLRPPVMQRFGPEDAVILPLVAASQERLRTEALELGAALYAVTSDEFTRRIREYWPVRRTR